MRSCSQRVQPRTWLEVTSPRLAQTLPLETSGSLPQKGTHPGLPGWYGALWNGIQFSTELGEQGASWPPSWSLCSLVPRGWGRGLLHLSTWVRPDLVAPGWLLFRLLPPPTGDFSTQRPRPGTQPWLTLEMERGTLKSLPPCSRKPQGAGPSSTTLKESMVPAPERREENVSGWHGGWTGRLSAGH